VEEILDLPTRGMTNAAIGDRLHPGHQTVRNYESGPATPARAGTSQIDDHPSRAL
jgi:hypothetical protein